MQTSLAAAVSETPRQERTGAGLGLLALAIMLERVGSFGMQGLLVLYMIDKTTGGLAWDQETALSVYSFFTGAIVVTPLIGAALADKVIGQRRAVVLGALFMIIGMLLLAISLPSTLYVALALVAIGGGLFKPSIYAMVGGLYDRNDPRRDGAFTLFSMPVSIGSFLAPIVCGALGQRFGWV